MKDKFYVKFYPYSYNLGDGHVRIKPREKDNYVGGFALLKQEKINDIIEVSESLEKVYELWIDNNGKLILSQLQEE